MGEPIEIREYGKDYYLSPSVESTLLLDSGKHMLSLLFYWLFHLFYLIVFYNVTYGSSYNWKNYDDGNLKYQ